MTAMPTTRHQRVATNLAAIIKRFVDGKKLGVVFGSPVDVVLSGVTVFQPDVSFLSHERSHIDDGKKLNAAPDVVVEILSQSTEERDRTFKFREYARGGAKEYWLASSENKEIEVFKNSKRGFQLVNIFRAPDILNSPLFGEINLDVKQVFE